MRAGTIEVWLTGNLTGLDNSLARAERNLRATGERLQRIGGALTAGLTLPIAAAVGITSRFGARFDAEMTKIETLVGVQPELVNRWRQALLELGPATARGPTELARALFVVTSAGVRGAGAMDILERSAQASAVGLGDTAEIARAVTSAVQAYGTSNLSAARAIDILVATVREGNLEASELAGSLGRVIGIAAQVGVTFEQVGAFVATFTRLGVSSEEAVTALRGTLNTLLKPSQQAEEALAAVGLSAAALREAVREKGLTATLNDLVAAFHGNEQGLAAVIPNVRALSGVLGTAGSQGAAFAAITDSITQSQGILDRAFERTRQTSAFTFGQVKAQAETIAIAFGRGMAPALADVLTASQPVLSAILRLGNAFSNLSPRMRTIIVGAAALAAALGPVMFIAGAVVKALSGLAGAARLLVRGFALLLTPAGAVAAAVAVIATWAYILIRNWDVVRLRFQLIWIEIANTVGAAVDAILSYLQDWLSWFPGAERFFGNLRRTAGGFFDRTVAGAGRVADALEQNVAQGFDAAAAAARRASSALDDGVGGGGGGDNEPRTASLAREIADAMGELQRSMRAIGVSEQLLGTHFDALDAEAQAVQQAMTALATAGVGVNDRLNDQGTTLQDLARRYLLLQDTITGIQSVHTSAAAAVAKLTEQLDEARRVTESVRTPAERYAAEIARLNGFLQMGFIDQETYNRAVREAGETLRRATDKVGVAVREGGEAVGRAFIRGIIEGSEGLGQTLARAMQALAENLIIDVFKDALKISSPSRVMADIGADTVAGFLRGLAAGMPAVNAGMAQMATAGVGATHLGTVRSGGVAGGPIVVQQHNTFEVRAIDSRDAAAFFEENAEHLSSQLARKAASSATLRARLGGR